MTATLTEIHRFPVKSMRGEALREVTVEPWGLDGDRRWMVVDDDAEAITAREVNRLLLLQPRLVPDGLVVSAAGRPDLEVAVPSGPPQPVTVHGHPLVAVPVPEADRWLSAALDRPAHLVHQADPTVRPVNPRFAHPDDRVNLADAYPLLVTTEASLADLNERIADGRDGAGDEEIGRLPMMRFRPNLVIAGTPAWAEDGWRRLRIGETVFRAVKGCDRCVMTTVDPDTAVRGKEPIATLARFRRYDKATWFGMNLIPDTPGAVLRVGDEVEILAAVDAPDGPPR